jgi:hypothetical protein
MTVSGARRRQSYGGQVCKTAFQPYAIKRIDRELSSGQNRYHQKMYLPPDFNKYDAVACGKLIDQAYQQYGAAKAPQPGAPPWSIQDEYTNCGSFSAIEQNQILPFGFVASKDNQLFVVIRGTQTPADDRNLTQLYSRLG